MAGNVCITGANRGLGLELSKQLLDHGYTVFAGWHKKCSRELQDLQQQFTEKLHLVEMEIANEESVKTAAGYIASKTSSLDILINNAAILGDIDTTIFDELDFDGIQKVFNVNALGPLRVTQALVQLVLKSEAKLIVNISSEAGSIGTCNRKGWFAYCMSKAALNMESTLIHNHLRDFGGQVLLIHPGWMQTYMRGQLDKLATFTPCESAAKIMQILLDHKQYCSDQPAFIDIDRVKWPW
jgi:NAD(P)-dependent dehydrogenase (short-subunit alcohol dehydrogenase family)